jgi:hypothetical protein
MIPVEFTAYTDIVVIGQNPEMADYDNPRGDIHGFASYVVAEAENGERRCRLVKVSRWEAEALPAAQRQADALNVRLANGKLPVAFDRWQQDRPAYGSAAWRDPDNIADELAWERELDDRR